jgi:4'-phosphopantetheinyl transferase
MSAVEDRNYVSGCSGSAVNITTDKNSGVVEVYFAETKDIIGEYARLKTFININDKLKADKLHFEEDRNTSLICHTILRLILSNKLNTDLSEIRILDEGNRKPRLEGDWLFFNISHTRDAFAFAISECCEVGIDLEKMDRSIDFKSIARKFFSNAERAFILDSPADSRNRFFLLWTRKEALLKALGTGIISNLSNVEVLSQGKVLNNKSFEEIDDSAFYDHFIYSEKISNYYLSVAMTQRVKIILHQLNTEKVQSYIEV